MALHLFHCLKLLQDKIQKISKYDPLDLFLEDQSRQRQALWHLFENPQNNLRVFVNSKPIPRDSWEFELCTVLNTSKDRVCGLISEAICLILDKTGRTACPNISMRGSPCCHRATFISSLLHLTNPRSCALCLPLAY